MKFWIGWSVLRTAMRQKIKDEKEACKRKQNSAEIMWTLFLFCYKCYIILILDIHLYGILAIDFLGRKRNHSHRNLWSTVSNALLRSKNKTRFIRPLSIFKSQLFVAFNNEVNVELAFLNPNWWSDNILLAYGYLIDYK